jgi:biopolymer transport protein ExbD
MRADAHAKYDTVSVVLDAVRSAGVERIGILVNQRRLLPWLNDGSAMTKSV